jgi:hypothetical protein
MIMINAMEGMITSMVKNLAPNRLKKMHIKKIKKMIKKNLKVK